MALLERVYFTFTQGYVVLSKLPRDNGNHLSINQEIGVDQEHSKRVVVSDVVEGIEPFIVIRLHQEILIGSISDIMISPTKNPDSNLAVHHDILIPVEDTTPTWFQNDISAYPRLLLTINHAST